MVVAEAIPLVMWSWASIITYLCIVLIYIAQHPFYTIQKGFSECMFVYIYIEEY